jgi:D-amino peptidase
MRIAIFTDNEGVCGVSKKDDIESPATREQLTAEVNAAVRGAVRCAVNAEFLVIDGHGGGYVPHNVLHAKLDARAELCNGVRLTELPLDESYDALFVIGAHSRAGTPQGILNHTIDSQMYMDIAINGRPVSEAEIWAALAGHRGIPLVLLSGDHWACEQVRESLPKVQCVAVKRGSSRFGGRHLSLQEACARIELAAECATQQAQQTEPLRYEGPVEVTYNCIYSDQADYLERIGGTRTDWRQVQFRAEHVWDALHYRNTFPSSERG